MFVLLLFAQRSGVGKLETSVLIDTVGNKGMEAEECLKTCNKSLDRDSEDKVQCSCMKDETT